MTRHSWFSAGWPVSIRTLATRLQAQPFTDEKNEGFQLERVREASLEATYYLKIPPRNSKVDPFGREIADGVTYKQVRFVASEGALGLELIDAPRNNQRFVSQLLEICDFSLTISPVRVDVNDWASAIAGSLGVAGYVDVVQYGGIDLGGGTIARVVVRGAKEVREAAERFIARPHAVEKIQLRLTGELKGSSVLLSESGSAKIASRESGLLVEAARSSLETVAASQV